MVVTTETKASRCLIILDAIPEMPSVVRLHLGVGVAEETTSLRIEVVLISGSESSSPRICISVLGGGHCARSAMSHTLLPVV